MKLDSYQRRAMLLRTEMLVYHGGSFNIINHPKYTYAPFLGDLIQLSDKEVLKAKHIGKKELRHIKDMVKEITGLNLGVEFDEETKRAFSEAKMFFQEGPEYAWPSWYTR